MSPRKVLAVAWRELIATVLTKGFVIGVVFMPLLVGAAIGVVPAMISAPPVHGTIAVVDRDGDVAPRVAERFPPGEALVPRVPGSVPEAFLTVQVEGRGADAEAAIASVRSGEKLAVVVVPEGMTRDPAASFELYAADRLDVMLQREVASRVGDAIVDARVHASGLDAAQVRRLIARPTYESRTITATGAEETNEIATVLLPGAFMLLLWMASFTAGQFLLTTLVEEKSARVMEVLLSAVSPLELLTGKILGQAGVGLLILFTYAVLGSGALSHFQLLHVLTPSLVALLVAFFLIAFMLIASVMAAVGSVVDDLRSAQSLLAPILFVLTLPTLLWLPITRAPSSTFATVASFVPPVGPFVTVLRLAGREPVPAWQIAGALASGALSVVIAIWAAGKVFQIGVLLYGKPPSARRMLGWLRGSGGR